MPKNKIQASHHFLTVTTVSGRTFLTPLPGQILRGKPLTDGITVKGCEKTWKRYPPGTTFGCSTLHVIRRKSSECYETNDLYPLCETDTEYDIFEAQVRNTLIEEYKTFTTVTD